MQCNRTTVAALSISLLLGGSAALAGEADVIKATAERMVANEWKFTVTVEHEDDGWAHYADAYEVLAPDGTVLGTRVLLHPHIMQPFTRLLTNVEIPRHITTVTVRAHDSVHEHGGATVEVELDWNRGS